MEPIIIKQSLKGNIVYICGAVLLSILSFSLLFINFQSSFDKTIVEPIIKSTVGYIITKVFLFLGFIFFGYAVYFLIKRAKKGDNILMIDQNGITDNSSDLALGFIAWQDIEKIYISGILTNEFIEIALKDEDKYIQKLSGVKKKAILANKKLGNELACITLNSTRVSPRKLLPQIQEMFEKYKNNQ